MEPLLVKDVSSLAQPDLDLPGPGTRVRVAETRAERAEARTELAEARAEQAKARTAQAETRIEHAQTRTEQAETRTEQAKTRTERAELRSEQAEIRMEAAEARVALAVIASELRFRRLFEASLDGILILDAVSGRIIDANPSIARMLGYGFDELLGTTLAQLGLFPDSKTNQDLLARLHAQDSPWQDDLWLKTKNGDRVAVEFVSNIYPVEDRSEIQCNLRDIRARKTAETEIRRLNETLEYRVAERTMELQLANEALESFSYSVSHDLRAPLRQIMGFIKLIKQNDEGGRSDQSDRHLAIIFQSAQRMGDLIDDLLAFSRLGRSALTKGKVDLNQAFAEVRDKFQAETAERGIVWKAPASLPVVWADRSLLLLVLTNLLSNAVKFTGRQTSPRIEIDRAGDQQGETVISIRDNGVGFDPKYVGKLFGVFQRLHTDAEFEGTGIGLANVQRIIQRHGGRVWAEAAEGQGATFYFSLPQEGAAPQE